MSKQIHRFSATIVRGGYFSRKVTGEITSAGNPSNLMFMLHKLFAEQDHDQHLGDLDSISLRISRIKPRKSKS